MALTRDPKKLFEGFYLRSAGVLIDLYNQGFGLGASFGVKSEDEFLQNLHFDFGFHVGEKGAMFGFNIGYGDRIEVSENGAVHYDVGVTNFVIPYFVIGYTHTFENKDTLHHFSQGVGGRPMIDISGGISTVGNFVALSVGKDKMEELQAGRKYYQNGLRNALNGIVHSSDVTEARVYDALASQ